MHVVVIGAGIIGVTTAYFLRRLGCEVTVLERNSGVAHEASFANGGVVAPGYTGPWAAPGVPGALLASMFQRDAALRVRLGFDPAQWRWLRRFVGESTLERYRLAKQRMHRLAVFSQAELHALQARHAIDYEQQAGLLQLFRTPEQLDRHAPIRALLAELGVPHRLLSAAECRTVECALNERTPLAGAVQFPSDETGNCAYFARRIKEISEDDGVRYAFGTVVQRLAHQGGRLAGVIAAQGVQPADACVLAAGAHSGALLSGTGIDLPLQPVRGFSATVPITRHDLAPRVAVMDERFKVAITRMGKRLRIAGTAIIGDRRTAVGDRDAGTLLKVASEWYPGAAHFSQARLWSGVRAMLPDGPPVLGRTPIEGLYLNLGHGSSGWALACGAARVVADLVTGRTPAIDLDGLTLDRFARPALNQAQPVFGAP